MSRNMVMAGAVALLVAAGAGAWWLAGRVSGPSSDELAAVAGDGLVTFARIQTEMNRAAAGKPVWSQDANADPLEAVGRAFREYLSGNTVKAANLLDDVDNEIDSRVPTDEQVSADPLLADKEEWLVSYFELLPEPPSGKGVGADTFVFNRLVVTLRKVDAVLLAEILPTLKGYDLVARHASPEASVFDGMALRLPCRLAGDHRAALEGAGKLLGQLAAGLTTCPVPRAKAGDFALLERLARDPAAVLAAVPAASPPPPRDLSTPLMTAAAKGGLADITKALDAGGDTQRADARGRTAFDYLLGNGAVAGQDRVQAIRSLF